MAPPRHVFKIVVTGPFAAGKTTFIETVVQREFLTTSAVASHLDESSVKHQTTVGMDFGALTLTDPDDGDIELRVYGTPGQERFSFMWEVLGEGADGFVVVVNGADESSWPSSLAHLAAMEGIGIAGVVALNRATEEDVARAARFFSPHGAPVVGCQAIDHDDVSRTLVAVLMQVLDKLEEDEPVDPSDLVEVPTIREGVR